MGKEVVVLMDVDEGTVVGVFSSIGLAIDRTGAKSGSASRIKREFAKDAFAEYKAPDGTVFSFAEFSIDIWY